MRSCPVLSGADISGADSSLARTALVRQVSLRARARMSQTRKRGPSGRFERDDVSAAQAPRHPLVGRSAWDLHSRPYYQCVSRADLLINMIPQLKKAVESADAPGATDLAWDPASPDLVPEITRLLDHIADLLPAGARACRLRAEVGTSAPASTSAPIQETLLGSQAFLSPPGPHPDLATCMQPTQASVKNASNISPTTRGHGYIRVKVGLPNIMEYAHRIVLWACYGPPPQDIVEPVVMHLCCHARGEFVCLNPEHMVWGEDAENFVNRFEEVDLEAMHRRMEEQRAGFSFFSHMFIGPHAPE